MSVRLSKLNQSFDYALESVFRDCSFEAFAQCFPQLLRDNPEFLKTCYQQFRQAMTKNLQSDFQNLLKEYNLEHHLKRLDEIVMEAKQMKNDGDVPMIPTEPERILAAHRYALKQQERDRLKKMLELAQQENAQELQEAKQKDDECRQMMADIEKLKSQLVF
ncbi:hypothetical protein EDD86DRAFT_202623 [Gorgonomyces haynaldii]|nr:hypothetical protein EDD86DRAFT_202623 [Gorgonomyces haynaldii]